MKNCAQGCGLLKISAQKRHRFANAVLHRILMRISQRRSLFVTAIAIDQIYLQGFQQHPFTPSVVFDQRVKYLPCPVNGCFISQILLAGDRFDQFKAPHAVTVFIK